MEPAKQTFHLSRVGDHESFQFTITAPPRSTTARIVASAEIQGTNYRSQHQEITYPHIPPQLLQSPAVLKALSPELVTRGHAVGYLPGAGDSLVDNLQQMGYAVKILDDANITAEQLHGLDAIVIGVRAFNVRSNIGAALPALFQYIKDGGTVIAQYNDSEGLKTDRIAPYDLHISRDRVTDERAVVSFLEPDNPVLNTPNKITSADFDGWVARARSILSQPMGRTFQADNSLWRSWRDTIERRLARGPIRQRIFHLHRTFLFPPASRWSARRLSTVR